jgi:hypothetical protein
MLSTPYVARVAVLAGPFRIDVVTLALLQFGIPNPFVAHLRWMDPQITNL